MQVFFHRTLSDNYGVDRAPDYVIDYRDLDYDSGTKKNYIDIIFSRFDLIFSKHA